MQDIWMALRQFYKSPGFAITVVLTMALGIGANTAIFTLVHAVLMKSLPVADPKTLFRVGDLDDCCVNGGFINDNGDFDLFSYELYKHLQETTPEFEQLAAMQSGGESVSARRGSEPAKSQRSQYVSGNFFTTFGVGPFAGRVLTDADDTPGAAPSAVMSYQAWQSDYGGDPSVVGSTFYLQGQPVTIVGIAPPGFFGDRIRSSPPALWIPLSVEPVVEIRNSILHVPDSNWLYVVGRLKPGREHGSAAGEDVGQSAAVAGDTAGVYAEWRRDGDSETACGDCAGRGWDSKPAAADGQGAVSADDDLGAGAAGCVRECGEPAAGAWRDAEGGDFDTDGAGCGEEQADPADADGELAAGVHGWIGGVGGGVCGDKDDSVARVSECAAVADCGESVAAGAGICLFVVAGDRCGVWDCAGVDHVALRSSGGACVA